MCECDATLVSFGRFSQETQVALAKVERHFSHISRAALEHVQAALEAVSLTACYHTHLHTYKALARHMPHSTLGWAENIFKVKYNLMASWAKQTKPKQPRPRRWKLQTSILYTLQRTLRRGYAKNMAWKKMNKAKHTFFHDRRGLEVSKRSNN